MRKKISERLTSQNKKYINKKIHGNFVKFHSYIFVQLPDNSK